MAATERSKRRLAPKKHLGQRSFLLTLREDVKYYFADFVRMGGTPPPPFADIPPRISLQKGLKMV